MLFWQEKLFQHHSLSPGSVFHFPHVYGPHYLTSALLLVILQQRWSWEWSSLNFLCCLSISRQRKHFSFFPSFSFSCWCLKWLSLLRPKLAGKMVWLVLERVTTVISNMCSLSSPAVLMLQRGGGKSWLKFSHCQVFDCASPDWALCSTNSAL